MLHQRLLKHDVSVYLINTGWTGGPYGVGTRIEIQQTRAMVSAALNGKLNQVTFHPHPIFKILVPEAVPGVEREILDPEKTWNDSVAYQQQAKLLARRFVENFQQFDQVPQEILAAAPEY
jgi:phosphoenolpyruvate carboxykinase (ATP)